METINDYIESIFTHPDSQLDDVLASIEENDMRQISVPPASGKLLTMLATMSGARRVLEIGALGGYSGICLARGMAEGGTLTSLELIEDYANLAKSNLTKAGLGDRVTYMTGPALESLEQLAGGGETFDFFFIDADKENYENYLEACIRIAESGALIVCDNVLARGTVADESAAPTRNTEIMKTFNKTVANHPKLESLLIPIGDGLTVSIVK
ncbi:Predicted O-methyltransferase YrrM [Bhargavaea ginsengi]|uniref:Predicted O-methyltransferase YrrM n=1 Tax=Bhargavaea ginsengi TaxID=426757 RepID=A0A1H6Z240_9BACL|nr:O-methyltransferase [Bhargavaea ginsengi]SEJ43035.1 Predicted O-methyltransferase YrrM [Bhargavaea ginsengi]